ncbi:MAG: beta-lactamase regulating signal transducer with metallopeptidase domain [Limisphaerales bacterium]|jgi:beta-lactamase regulating signal transducer with metallopeptidase domain
MIALLIGSFLLSIAGAVIYFTLRSYLDIQWRKRVLVTVLTLSLFLPALVWMNYESADIPEVSINSSQAPQVTDINIAYDLVTTEPGSGELRINEHQVAIFHPVAQYDWWISHRSTTFKFALGFIVFAFLIAIARILWLFNIVRKSTSRTEEVDGFKFELLYSNNNSAPGSFRLHKAFILWNSTLDNIDPKKREAILLHEIAHLKQGHSLEMIAMELLRTIWWLNPAWHLCRRELRQVNEFLADQFAVNKTGDKIAYARLLLATGGGGNTEEWMVQQFGTHPLKKRIEQILRPAKNRIPALPLSLGLVLALSFTSLFAVPAVIEKEADIASYEIQWCINQATGQLIFCDDCYTEGLDCACVGE